MLTILDIQTRCLNYISLQSIKIFTLILSYLPNTNSNFDGIGYLNDFS